MSIDTAWIGAHVPGEKQVQYAAFAQETELTPATLREWYDYARPFVPEGLFVYLCVVPAPSSGGEFFFYARRVAQIAFGEEFMDYVRPAVPGTPAGLRPGDWRLCTSPPDANGSLTTDPRDLPYPPSWDDEDEDESARSPAPLEAAPVEVSSGKACAVCQTPLLGRRADAAYCSVSCRKKAWRKTQKREQTAEGKEENTHV